MKIYYETKEAQCDMVSTSLKKYLFALSKRHHENEMFFFRSNLKDNTRLSKQHVRFIN